MTDKQKVGAGPLRYALTIFVSSFLLFQIQPMIARKILPWFGGTSSVWSTCMLFFQSVLLLGYTLAHVIYSRTSPRAQAFIFISLLAVSLLTLDVSPDISWKPESVEGPSRRILVLLAAHVGLPYLILSTVSPLLQGWFAITSAGSSPYRLYALSNFGSLLALISYPFVIEPAFSLNLQTRLWSWGYLLFVLCGAFCAVKLARGKGAPLRATSATEAERNAPDAAPAAGRKLLWFLLSSCSSILLLGITNHLCHNVMVVPFLWVWPLTIYLTTFILCFESTRWYDRKRYFALSVLLILASCVHDLGDYQLTIPLVFLIFSALLFCGCMACHGELVNLKPEAGHLTSFYLFLSLGGAAGGVFVGLIAPVAFDSFAEMPIGMIMLVSLMAAILCLDKRSDLYLLATPITILALIAGYSSIVYTVVKDSRRDDRGAIARTRNFYGMLKVIEHDESDPERHCHMLQHGSVIHGLQFLAPGRRGEPTAYYGPGSGVSLAIRNLKPPGQRRIGVLGLGVGTVAAFGESGDYIRYYEINPDVIRYAQEYFSYLKDTPAKVDLVLGDARLSLEREEPNGFDVLAIDAFTGDSVPVHLITTQAIELYLRHLSPDGVIVFNISTQHFELAPLLDRIAKHFGLELAVIKSTADMKNNIYPTVFGLLSRNRDFMNKPEIRGAARPAEEHAGDVSLWTDDYSNVFELLRKSVL